MIPNPQQGFSITRSDQLQMRSEVDGVPVHHNQREPQETLSPDRANLLRSLTGSVGVVSAALLRAGD